MLGVSTETLKNDFKKIQVLASQDLMNIPDQDPAVGVPVGGMRLTGRSQNPWKRKDGRFSDLRTQLKAQNEDKQSTSHSRLFHSLEKAEEISMESPTPQKYSQSKGEKGYLMPVSTTTPGMCSSEGQNSKDSKLGMVPKCAKKVRGVFFEIILR